MDSPCLSFFAMVIASSVLVFGFSSYVLNFLEHGHPLHPLFGEDAKDIMTGNSPASFASSGNLRKLPLGFFSQSSNISAASGNEPALKIPINVTPQELKSLRISDLRIGGFGVLYSGILILQTAIIAVALPMQRKMRPFLFQVCLCYLIPTIALMLFLGESWWARYCSYFYTSQAARPFSFLCCPSSEGLRGWNLPGRYAAPCSLCCSR